MVGRWRLDGELMGGKEEEGVGLALGDELRLENRLRSNLCSQGDWVGLQGKRLPQNTGLSLKRWLTCGSLWEVCGRGRVRDERCRQEISEPSRARMPRAEANPSPHLRKQEERKCGEASSLRLEGSNATCISQMYLTFPSDLSYAEHCRRVLGTFFDSIF